MSDGYPWGIWITYDVATGTAIACGGYAVAILVYIRNRMHYHPLIRSCILTSMFGYGLAGFSVMVDLGRPWNAYNFFVPSKWQANSAMFEVALCVMAYSTVLIIEFLPAILYSLETSRWHRLHSAMDWLHPDLVPDEGQGASKVEWVQCRGWLAAAAAGEGLDRLHCPGDYAADDAPIVAGLDAADRQHQAAPALAHAFSAPALSDQLHLHRLWDCDSGIDHLLLRFPASIRSRCTAGSGGNRSLAGDRLAGGRGGDLAWRGQLARAFASGFLFVLLPDGVPVAGLGS